MSASSAERDHEGWLAGLPVGEALYEVRRERNVLIALDDGVELAADVYLPDAPGKVPAVVSFYPYHKDEFIGGYVEYARTYLAQRGYASLLVDFRGTGSSGGVCPVTFDTEREGGDGAQVVEWAAAQDWCDGGVAVWGVSYGGIMSLAVAAQRPPHLKAIAPIFGCSDVHLDFVAPGGCRNCYGATGWLSLVLALDLAPPGFQDQAGRWMRVWRERLGRLERGDIWPLDWQLHNDHDEYWQAKAIPTEQVEVPTFVIGGWRDIFPSAMPDAYERVSGPKKLLMGPWVHLVPDLSPYASADWLHELRRFFDHWLKGVDNGISQEPEVTLYVQGAERWRHEREWPIARAQMQDWYLQPGRGLGTAPAQGDGGDSYRADPTIGTSSTLWDPLGLGLGYPLEQAEDDLRSLTYTSAPLEHGVEITGSPEAILRVVLEDGDDLQLVAKLNAVAPDGSSRLITTGWLSAAHRESPEHARVVERGLVAEYRIPLWATSYFVPAGHRLRLAIACSDFPRIWPLRSNPTVRVELAGSLLRIPIVPDTTEPLDAPALPIPDPSVDRAPWLPAADQPEWKIERNAVTGAVSVEVAATTDIRTPTGTRFDLHQSVRATTSATRPDSAAVHAEAHIDVHLPGGEHIEVRTRSRFTRDTTHMTGEVTLDGCRLFAGTWQQRDGQRARLSGPSDHVASAKESE